MKRGIYNIQNGIQKERLLDLRCMRKFTSAGHTMDFLHALIIIQGRTLVPIQSPLFTVQSLSHLMVCFVTYRHMVEWVRLPSKFFQSLSTASPLERNNTRRGQYCGYGTKIKHFSTRLRGSQFSSRKRIAGMPRIVRIQSIAEVMLLVINLPSS